MFILGQVRLSKGQLCLAGLGKGRISVPRKIQEQKKENIPFQIIFNNPGSSIKLESVTDPKNSQNIWNTKNNRKESWMDIWTKLFTEQMFSDHEKESE